MLSIKRTSAKTAIQPTVGFSPRWQFEAFQYLQFRNISTSGYYFIKTLSDHNPSVQSGLNQAQSYDFRTRFWYFTAIFSAVREKSRSLRLLIAKPKIRAR